MTTIDFTNESWGASSYDWSFNIDGTIENDNTTDPTFTFPNANAGSYEVCLTAITANGCPDSICDTVHIDPEYLLYVPNSFTPNGDGTNDVFIASDTRTRPNQL